MCCNHCGKRPEPASVWPECVDCGEAICPQCATAGTVFDEREGRAYVRCRRCDDVQEAEALAYGWGV